MHTTCKFIYLINKKTKIKGNNLKCTRLFNGEVRRQLGLQIYNRDSYEESHSSLENWN